MLVLTGACAVSLDILSSVLFIPIVPGILETRVQVLVQDESYLVIDQVSLLIRVVCIGLSWLWNMSVRNTGVLI